MLTACGGSSSSDNKNNSALESGIGNDINICEFAFPAQDQIAIITEYRDGETNPNKSITETTEVYQGGKQGTIITKEVNTYKSSDDTIHTTTYEDKRTFTITDNQFKVFFEFYTNGEKSEFTDESTGTCLYTTGEQVTHPADVNGDVADDIVYGPFNDASGLPIELDKSIKPLNYIIVVSRYKRLIDSENSDVKAFEYADVYFNVLNKEQGEVGRIAYEYCPLDVSLSLYGNQASVCHGTEVWTYKIQ
ncbi:MAG: hypothetical protein WAO12_00135 [Venatoribacter sp.]